MSLDKLVDSTQLNTDLTSVANAIRAKSGGSGQLAFPAGFVSEIGNIPSGGGGDPYEKLRDVMSNSAESIDIDMDNKELLCGRPFSISALKHMKITNILKCRYGYSSYMCFGSKLIDLVMVFSPTSNVTDNYVPTSMCDSVSTLKSVDVTKICSVSARAFYGSGVDKLILRVSDRVVSLSNANILGNTPFSSGGAGGTIYIPKAMYDHLGDGTSLDYKAATNWSTIDGYGTITWAKIEGSIYETKYVDGSTIPT